MDKNYSITVPHLVIRGRHNQAVVQSRYEQQQCNDSTSWGPFFCKRIKIGRRPHTMKPKPWTFGNCSGNFRILHRIRGLRVWQQRGIIVVKNLGLQSQCIIRGNSSMEPGNQIVFYFLIDPLTAIKFRRLSISSNLFLLLLQSRKAQG